MPTASNPALPVYLGNDADFQAFCTGIHNMLTTAGLVQTTDTGQMNPATVLRPAINSFAGYLMYRFNDALQATVPLFLKLEYGISGNATLAALRLSVASATNGAGAMAGTVYLTNVSWSVSYASPPAAGLTRPAFACVAQSAAVLFTGSASVFDWHLGFMVERLRNPDGTPNGSGVHMCMIAGGTGGGSSVNETVALSSAPLGPRTMRGQFPSMPPPGVAAAAATGVEGVDVGVYPGYPIRGTARPPSLAIVSYFPADITLDTQFQVQRYGVLRTYRAMGGVAPMWSVDGASTGARTTANQLAPAILYE